jgi:uncharacterized protein (DUF1015 family)
MADVQPLEALHYDQANAGPLQQLVAPPYDVIDPEQRAELAARSPHNVVRVDLPEGDDPYAEAARLFAQWQDEGAVVRDETPAFWALVQDYTGPDGRRLTRRGIFARVRVTEYGAGKIRPHERTHPGPREDRLKLTRATASTTTRSRPRGRRSSRTSKATPTARRAMTTEPSTVCGGSAIPRRSRRCNRRSRPPSC